MEGIREQLVKKAFDSSDRAKTYGVLAGSLLLAIIVFFLITYVMGWAMVVVALIFAGAIMYGGYWLTGEFNVEYEYCFSSGELIVDKVINQRRRKPMCSVNLRSADAFYKEPKKLPDDTTRFSAIGDGGEVYAIEFKDSKYGRSLLLFTPNDKMLEVIKPYLPRII